MFNWSRTPILERSLKEGTDMSTSTLDGFVCFAYQFLDVFENDLNRLCDINLVDKEVDELEVLKKRLESFKLLLGEREKQYLKQAQCESTMQEVALLWPQNKSMDEGLSPEEILKEKEQCSAILWQELECDWEDILAAFNGLQARVTELKDKTFEKPKQKP